LRVPAARGVKIAAGTWRGKLLEIALFRKVKVTLSEQKAGF